MPILLAMHGLFIRSDLVRGPARSLRIVCRLALGGLLLVSADRAAWATPMIVVGDHHLWPNRPHQEIRLFVSGGDAVQGLDLLVQVGDGGSAVGGDDLGPVITNVDVTTGTIFAQDEPDVSAVVPTPLLWSVAMTVKNSVPTEGLLATLTLDTTGFFEGTFVTLSLEDTVAGSTDFAGVPADIIDGSISVVDSPWRNPVDALDVDADGFLAPLDALTVIDKLNTVGPRALDPPVPPAGPPPYIDVNGDFNLAPIDALLVIDELNRRVSLQNLQPSLAAMSLVPEPRTAILAVASLASLCWYAGLRSKRKRPNRPGGRSGRRNEPPFN